jgi:hypothetical protein
LQFRLGGAIPLRDREVLAQSVRAMYRHRAGDPNQFAGLDVEDFPVLVIEKFLAQFHVRLLVKFSHIFAEPG